MTSARTRWKTNLGLMAADALTIRFLFPVMPAGFAVLCREKGWGLFNQLDLPFGLSVAAGLVFLDFSLYLQHVLFHHLPAFWRIHRVHHSDLDFDCTTGIRFHPLEYIISTGIKISAVFLAGLPAVSVLAFESILNGTSMFSHSNIRLPTAFDRRLRLGLVTPDMHRVHHSVIIHERNSHFGFCLPVWDRLLGSYRPQPEKGHDEMAIGLGSLRDPEAVSFARILVLPLTPSTP